ncbi:conserved exported hypothetical protein [Gammaproteobacteria bacterium]
MLFKKAKGYGILAALVVLASLAHVAEARDYEQRGPIVIHNDWRDDVRITVWTHAKERIGGHWTINSGDTATLEYEGENIKVRPNYKIKVGEDWGWVNVADVGRFRHGTWKLNVRDIWRATHQDRGERHHNPRDWDPDRPYNRPLPDFLRP